MKRYAMMQLEEWNSGAKRIPLVIRGARQVGKTWLMQEFGSSHFKKTVYINFDNNQRMKTLFEGDYDISRIIMGLEIESGQNIRPGRYATGIRRNSGGTTGNVLAQIF